MATRLADEPRCQLVEGDFFARARDNGLGPDRPGRRFDAILADIDHAPDHPLDQRRDGFCHFGGLCALRCHLKPGGIFGRWSNETADELFMDRPGAAFADARAEPVTFDGPLTGQPFTQTFYLARTEAE